MAPNAIDKFSGPKVGVILVAVLAGVLVVAWAFWQGTDVLSEVQDARGVEAAAKGSVIQSGGASLDGRTVQTQGGGVAPSQQKPSAPLLMDRAGDGRPAVSAKRQTALAYDAVLRCRAYANTKRKVEHMGDTTAVYSAGAAESVIAELNRLEVTLEHGREACHGTNIRDIDNAVFALALNEGLQGDLGAQGCFVGGTLYESSGLRQDADQRAQYLAHAPSFLEHGIEANYWPLVSVAVARLIDSKSAQPPWLRRLPAPDPERVYRAVRLAYYRSDAAGVDSLEAVMNSLATQYQLGPGAVREADRWALREYRASYAASAPLHSTTTPFCQ